jgi:MinD superfamily P-loop ATPase
LGKTSLAGAFSALAKEGKLADCDVDAPDLHLLLDPEVVESGPFIGG